MYQYCIKFCDPKVSGLIFDKLIHKRNSGINIGKQYFVFNLSYSKSMLAKGGNTRSAKWDPEEKSKRFCQLKFQVYLELK